MISLIVLAAAMLAGGSQAHAQETANDPAPQQGPPNSEERLSHIEEQLQKLQTHNTQLQKSYDELSRKYVHVIQQGKEPVFGANAKNPDGMGIPGGVELGPDAPAKKGGKEKQGSR